MFQNILNDTPFLSTINIRFLMISLLYILHLYFICAFFSNVNDQVCVQYFTITLLQDIITKYHILNA